jgi:small subunit ribosomal protein S9
VADAKSKKTYYLGTGRRKTAVARVRMCDGTGHVTINGKAVEKHFTEEKDRNSVYGPLKLTEMRNRVDVSITVSGGGYTGQAGAVSQGIARALKQYFGITSPEPAKSAAPPQADGEQPAATQAAPNMAKVLRDSGYLTRDGRMKERKKYGRKGARKSFQFSKR